LPRHYTVLNCEQPKQGGIDRQGIAEGSVRSGVNGLRYADVSYKADGIQECGEKNQIASDTIQEYCDSAEHCLMGPPAPPPGDTPSLCRTYRLC